MRAIWEQEQNNKMVLKMDKLNLQLLSNFVKAVKKVKTTRWKKTTTPKNKCNANFLFRWTVMLIVGFYKWICFQNTKVFLESEIPNCDGMELWSSGWTDSPPALPRLRLRHPLQVAPRRLPVAPHLRSAQGASSCRPACPLCRRWSPSWELLSERCRTLPDYDYN